MEKLRRENDTLKTELAMEFRQFRKPADPGSSDRVAQVLTCVPASKCAAMYSDSIVPLAVVGTATWIFSRCVRVL